jgi:CubicO group peptidase (beta-lactamase class C family)
MSIDRTTAAGPPGSGLSAAESCGPAGAHGVRSTPATSCILLAFPTCMLQPLVAFALVAALAGPGATAVAQPRAALDPPRLAGIVAAADRLEPLHTLLVSQDGKVVLERGFGGQRTTSPTNIKSASKAVLGALVGIAIDRGVIRGVDQPIEAWLRRDFPERPDPRLDDITIGHLLSMQAGLERTSGANYGRWTGSRNWVRHALAQPFVDVPGGTMLYSTGSSHLLSAILTRASGRSTLALARDWLRPVEGFAIADWMQDPQGIYFGGNQMAMSPRSLMAFGELYRRGGVTADGVRVIPAAWVRQSWTPHTESRFTGDAHGYGWFIRRMAGHQVFYAWGYGGQMLHVVPSRALTVVMTSDDTSPSARTGHRDDLHDLMAQIIAAS